MTEQIDTTVILPKRRGYVGIDCPGCGQPLYRRQNLIACDSNGCTFLATAIRVYTIPGESMQPLVHIVSWVHPTHGPKVTIKGSMYVKSPEHWQRIRDAIIKPLVEYWAEEWIAMGHHTPEVAADAVNVLLYEAGRDMARERWEREHQGEVKAQ